MELGKLVEEEEEEEEGITFQAREEGGNPFDGLVEKEKDKNNLSRSSSRRSVHFDSPSPMIPDGKVVNGKHPNGMLESHFGYDDKKNPFLDTFQD